jgi:hypothetical protein
VPATVLPAHSRRQGRFPEAAPVKPQASPMIRVPKHYIQTRDEVAKLVPIT